MEQSVSVKMTTSLAPGTYAGVLKGRPKDRMSGRYSKIVGMFVSFLLK